MRGIAQIVGKTITHVIVREGAVSPRNQVFLFFDDGTSYEIFTDAPYLGLSSQLGHSTADQVRASLAAADRLYEAP